MQSKEPKVNIAINAARSAAKEIHKFARRMDKVKIYEKGPTDFVTQVDEIAEKIIISTINDSFPESSFICEESGRSGPENAELVWVIDPIDGTTNFIHGFPYYSISIACYEKEILSHGVIYDITRDDEYYASKGKGAYLNQERLRVSKIKSLKNSLLCNSFHSGKIEPELNTLDVIRKLYSHNLTLRRTGSTAIDLAYVAAGRLDAFVGYGMKHWDFAAGNLLVQEAGGYVSNFFGEATVDNSHHLIAGNKNCVELILQDIKESFK